MNYCEEYKIKKLLSKIFYLNKSIFYLILIKIIFKKYFYKIVVLNLTESLDF